MKKLTVLAAAFAAGLTSFAANSAPHPSHSLRGEGAESAPVAKAQDKSGAKDTKQQEKTTNRTETRQPKKGSAGAEIVKTPLFIIRDAAGENNQAAEKSQPKSKRVAGKGAQKKQVAEKAEPKKKRAAKTDEPKRERVAIKNAPKAKQTAQKRTRKTKQVAEKNTLKAKKVAEKSAPKAEKAAEKSASKPRDGGDRQVAVKESVELDLIETAAIGGKGAKTMKGAGGEYGAIIAQYAASYGVPVSLAHAVIQVESNYQPDARGSAGEVGLMQIKPATARMMGYSGSTQGLFHPETNIKFGMKYLAKAHKLGGGTTCGTILKYNAGHAAKRMNPVSSAYCTKVKRFLGV
jgi:soluble lytic murein transglycosylase-like protein